MRQGVKLLGGGVVAIPGALNAEEQADLLQDCMKTMQAERAGGINCGDKLPPDHVWAYGQEGHVPQTTRPKCLEHAAQLLERLGYAQRQLIDADSKEGDCSLHLYPLLRKLTFNRVWARLYAADRGLGWHRDPDQNLRGWVCMVNMGADATFAWRHDGRTHRLRLASGDGLLFNGCVLEHAVEQIHDGTCPAFWLDAMRGSGFVRVGLQMRN